MNIIYKTVYSTNKPSSIEVTKNTVYLRKDYTVDTTETDETPIWSYQEAALSLEDFNSYVDVILVENAIKSSNNADNIEKIMQSQESGDGNQLSIMEAITDLYDMISAIGAVNDG